MATAFGQSEMFFCGFVFRKKDGRCKIKKCEELTDFTLFGVITYVTWQVYLLSCKWFWTAGRMDSGAWVCWHMRLSAEDKLFCLMLCVLCTFSLSKINNNKVLFCQALHICYYLCHDCCGCINLFFMWTANEWRLHFLFLLSPEIRAKAALPEGNWFNGVKGQGFCTKP